MNRTRDSSRQHQLNAITAALSQAQQYGESGDGAEAENFCLDVLTCGDTVDEARENLMLALIDRFEQDPDNLVALWIYCPSLRSTMKSLTTSP